MHPFEEASAKAILARPATPDDPRSEVLVIGEHFDYLVMGSDDKFYKIDRAEHPSAPSRIVIDADSFLSGLTGDQDEFGFEHLAVRRGDDLLIRVQAIGPVHPTGRVFPDET